MADPQTLPAAFWRLITARTLYTFASQMQAVLIGWTVYATTHSATALGLVGLAEALPALSLALTAGDAVDQGRPLVIYRRALWATTVSAGLLAVTLHASQNQTVYLLAALYSASFVTGLARAFFNPCMFALVPRMIPSNLLPKSAAVMSASLQLARVLGPALGGLGYGLLGANVAIDAVFVLLLLAQLAVWSSVAPPAPHRATEHHQGARGRLLEGLSFVWREPTLLASLTLDMVSVLFGGVTAVLPIFAEQVLDVGSLGLGLLRAAPAAGSMLVALWLAHFDIRRRAGVALLVAVTGFGLCILGFAASTNAIVSWFLLALSGAFDGVSMMVRTLIVQLRSPDSMRGRISAVNSMFVGSSNELGELESGLAAAYLGLIPSVIFGGTICLLTVAFAALTSAGLRGLNLHTSVAEVPNKRPNGAV